MSNINWIWGKVISYGFIHCSIWMLILVLFITSFTSCATTNKELLSIKEQGSFANGGSVIKNQGKSDPVKRTPEGQTFHGDLMAFDAAANMDLINQLLLIMAGSKADTWYMTDYAFGLATDTKEKKLFLIEGATHIQTCYAPQYIRSGNKQTQGVIWKLFINKRRTI